MANEEMTNMSELKPQGPRGIAYEKATLIKAAEVSRFLWGDQKAGYVSDWIYGSSPKIHMMSFEMAVGARFGNSPDFKTYYNCAETYHCLKGEFTFHCPESGEVHVLHKGDTLYFPPNTWHWGYNFGSETSHILECLTPRVEEAIEAYAVKQPWLTDIRYGQRELMGHYRPGDGRGKRRATVARAGDYLYEIVGERQPMRVGLVCSTDMLTVGIVELHAGQESEIVSHPGMPRRPRQCLSPRRKPKLVGTSTGRFGVHSWRDKTCILQYVGSHGKVHLRCRAQLRMSASQKAGREPGKRQTSGTKTNNKY
jgi:mannose-6-phosphate isomerase-like protein (cupin superfamily)